MEADTRSTLRDRLAATLGARPEILEAYLFGSEARGDASAHSDVDVAVYEEVFRPRSTRSSMRKRARSTSR